MADTLRIKRRVTGSPGAPSGLANAELAYNEVDHILYYGEGTGGTGGTASVITAIGGLGLASNANPVMNGTVLPGSANAWSRADHVHPSDTTRAPLASPAFTGVPTAPTATAGTNTTQLATTAFVTAGLNASVVSFNTRTGAVVLLAADVTGVGGALLASPTFTGTPAAPTAIAGTATTQIATTAFVQAAIGGSVTSFNTRTGAIVLLAADVTGVGGALLASPTFTGTPAAPTAVAGTNTTQLATTAFVTAAIGAIPTGVASFNTRTGAVTLTLADVTGVGGAPLASPSFTGLVTIGGTIGGAGMTAYFAAPPAIGGTTAGSAAFTTLSASGTVSGAGFTALFAAPPAIGATTPAAASFTTLTASGTVSGAGFTALLAPYALATSVPTAASTNPLVNGTVAIGVLSTYARADHVHPTDASRAPLASPTFTGVPAAPTATAGTSTTQLATTAFVATSFAPLASPTFTGVPAGPTAANGTNTTQLATTAFVLATRQDQFQPPNVDVSWNSHRIINLLDPQNSQDVATKNYVDNNATGLSSRAAAQVATAGANITTLSGLLTIDGYTCVAGDRVLVKDQTTQANNGIYVASATAWARAADMNTWAAHPQAYVFVINGTVNASSSWVCNAPVTGTLGTTPITWVQFSQAAQITAGNGLSKTGNTLAVVGTTNRILVGAAVDIAATYVGQTSITTLGSIATGTWNGTTIAVARGGTGAVTLTGYVRGNGVGAMTAVASIPNTDITGLGTMSVQDAGAVAITGGTIDNVVFDMGTF